MFNLKRHFHSLLAVILAALMLAGCNTKPTDSATPTVSPSESSVPTEQPEDRTPVKLLFPISSQHEERGTYSDVIDYVQKLLAEQGKDFITVETLVIPGAGEEATRKMMINAMAGDVMDLGYMNTADNLRFGNAGLLTPLDDYFEQAGEDPDEIFGNNIMRINDELYQIPATKDVHVTLYNKKMFDDAGIPYPEKGTWTWDKFLEVAKQLTNEAEGKFGVIFPHWDVYGNMMAKQAGAAVYKTDGSSNFDADVWKENIQWYIDLGNLHKVAPSILDMASKKYDFNTFWTSGNFGMTIIGSWGLSNNRNMVSFPRDYQIGVAPAPQVKAGENTTLGIIGGYSVFSTSKNPKAAFEAANLIAKYQWTKRIGSVPARVDLSVVEQSLMNANLIKGLEFDGITIEDIEDSITGEDLKVVDEKFFGPGGIQSNSNFTKAYELLASGQQSLDSIMADLKEKADIAIEEDKELNK